MRLLKYNDFLNESVSTGIAQLLQSVDAKQVDFYYLLGINKDKFNGKSINDIYDDSDFNKQVYTKKLKKGELVSTLDTENFLKKQYNIKYFFLIERDTPKLDSPKYIILQYNKRGGDWSDVFMYKIHGDIRNFFEKLTSKTIEIIDGNKRYVYQTSNSGNNWTLQNIDDENKTFKETIESDELRDILNNKNLNLNVIE